MSSNITNKRKFPTLLEYGYNVYNAEEKVYRDNSAFVESCIAHTALLFTRPPQLGKTTLLSLADLLLSNTKNAPNGLDYTPPEGVRNSWYVLRIDFGGISDVVDSTDWKTRAKSLDEQVRDKIRRCVTSFLKQHDTVSNEFYEQLDKGSIKDKPAGVWIEMLAQSIADVHAKSATRPTLLVLVDEYDKPVRDVLFDRIGSRMINVRAALKKQYSQYVSFFDNCKSAGTLDIEIKTWATGITPVGLSLITGFKYDDLTFDESMADAVGLLDEDVSRMLDAVHEYTPFQDAQQKTQVREVLREYYNHLQFPFGKPLYHTGMVNQVMTALQDKPMLRKSWLADLTKPLDRVHAEAVPGSVFDVVKGAEMGDLRVVVNQLVENFSVAGFELKESLSLISLLENGVLTTNDYLTLLVHLGVVSVRQGSNGTEFKSTSRLYRERHLNSLNLALASSIADLLALKTKAEMYTQGEAIIENFLKALSETRMASLIAWVGFSPDGGNRILELQLQGSTVAELYDAFNVATSTRQAVATQEDNLESGRSDVTITTSSSVVVLELKKKDSARPPTSTQWEGFHNQLRGYVRDRRMESPDKIVAGFVLVMYNGGRNYAVQKLTRDEV
jgi:hypothetical protein